ncbi:MAG: ATP-binding cassette domain-containing protein [Streptosporangiales bacterium]|nr:ATP-binding cassette domain-containing protein [Streptosporangiales bacterium]
MAPLLEIDDLTIAFDTDDGDVTVVDGFSLDVGEGDTVGIVGESGSGKSVTALTVMRLLAMPPARIVRGAIRYRGRDLLTASPAELRAVRGSEIAMIYQDPMTALNPALTVRSQLTQVMRHNLGIGRSEARRRAVEWLGRVGIPDAEQRVRDYPHQFSGGQRQRLVIALALCCDPSLLIADEPTTALDVTVQAQILELVRDLRTQFGTAVVWITHDLGVVAGLVDRVAVMYAGRIVERAPVGPLFDRPRHPYTAGLLCSVPPRTGERRRLRPIAGTPPDLARLGGGCPFQPRCDSAVDECVDTVPALTQVSGATAGHDAGCLRQDELTLAVPAPPAATSLGTEEETA